MKYNFVIEGKEYIVEIKQVFEDKATVIVNDKELNVELKSKEKPTQSVSFVSVAASPVIKKFATDNNIRAPIPGLISKILIKPGDKVRVGQPVIIMEAMKMLNEIQALKEGTIKTIEIKVGDSVLESTVLAKYE